jgi:hypothetical protein
LSEKGRKKANKYVEKAKEFLMRAYILCEQPFLKVDELKICVKENIEILGREWCGEVTAEELAEIKKAMVSG